ncbi:uncharacterized protein TNCT_126891 [Trichonephila clavata]|uniref:Uncharacterized protein n=1 Tax=Trichonephila clavata TaxID=2740835 RepID=A0A8X6GWK7_TRICU|nr:uncharacterized protein TNCT_126891 [Trichonephila clavata]
MSSIAQQEPMKPAPKSPIPRSRSDFSYVGLTPKEKRWTTDFSLLLPPFSRDTSGYSRLAESPVTLQPKSRNHAVMKISKSPTLDQTDETKAPVKSPALESGISENNACNNTIKEPKPIGRSQTMEPNGISTHESKRALNSKIIPRSPTLEPYTTNGASRSESKRTVAISRSPTLEPYVPKAKISGDLKTLYPRMELSPVGCPKVSHRLSPLVNPSITDCNRHLTSIRKSPTMDSKTLRYSPLLNQHMISRSPTLDPSVLNRSPRCSIANGGVISRSPLSTSRGLSTEVVRSQSLRSLRKGMDKSPSKMKNSDSAQCDVSCFRHK